MVHNEKGFMYPLTLCFLILFSMVLLMSIEYYLTEKKMAFETENILKQDYYLLRTVQSLEDLLSAGAIEETAGSFEYEDGQADYSIVEITESLWDVSIILKTGGHANFEGHAYYDKDLQKMIKWIEMK